MTEAHDHPHSSVSRRTVLRRSALVGGTMVWTLPVVQSLAGPAFATTGTPAPGNFVGISYVIVLAKCGDTYFLAKYEDAPDGTAPDGTYSVDGCGDQTQASGPQDDNTCRDGLAKLKQLAGTNLSPDCPSYGFTGVNGSGSLTIELSAGCELAGFVVHDGQLMADPRRCYYDAGALGTGGSLVSPNFNFTVPTVGSFGDIVFGKSPKTTTP